MVKIFNPEPDESVVKTIICRECGVKLQYVPYEVMNYTNRYYDGTSVDIRYIDCPNCVSRVHII